MQQVVHGFAGKRRSRGSQQAGGGRIGKADFAMAVHAANAVGNRIQQNLLLAVEFFGPAALLGAGQHLSKRSGCGLNGGHGVVVFAEPERAVELEDCQDVVADAHRHCPSGDHLLAQGGLDAGGSGNGIEVGDPDRAALFPGAARQLGAARQGQAHALLNEGFRAMPRRAPRGRELKLVLLCVDLPLDGQIPSLGDAERLEDAHRGNLRRRAFADDLADDQLQRQAVFALLLVGHVAQQAANGERIAGLLPLAQIQFELEDAAVGSVVAQRGAFNRLAVEGAAE